MSKNAIKRILSKDIKNLAKLNLDDLGIYIEFNEENILEAKAMIIGPKDSIYENGILLFDIIFPHDYPYSPPKVHYISRGSIRIHPNLYTGTANTHYLGKVCLSILGTWNGPQWTTIMDIGTVLLSIQSLLNNNPLDNEPGYSNRKTHLHDKYSKCVAYETYRTLIYKNYNDIPEKFMCFQDIITKHITTNKMNILDKLDSYINDTYYNNSIVVVPIYRIKLKLDYESIKQKLLKI